MPGVAGLTVVVRVPGAAEPSSVGIRLSEQVRHSSRTEDDQSSAA